MMLSHWRPSRILAWREPVDMRKSFDGLVGLVRGAMHEQEFTSNDRSC